MNQVKLLKYLKHYFILIIAFFCHPNINSQSRTEVLDYIEKYKDVALKIEKDYGIPATIVLAQGILESAAGTSSLTQASNNHFCIKAGSSWAGPVYLAWDDEEQKSRFRSYNSPKESFDDYAKLISTSKFYSSLFDINIYDYRRWALGLKKAGYATASNYAQALIGIIDYYKIYNINGGAKLRPGKTVVITEYTTVEHPSFEADQVLEDDEITQEEAEVVENICNYVAEINGLHCAVIQMGENLASVSRKYDISLSELLKLNELSSAKHIKEGDIIFLEKKKKKYNGSQDVYIASGGESLHEVSQTFGIQLKQLAKLNKVSEYVILQKGARISLK